jgi:uncharacterized protein (DUF2236 family)
MGVRLALVPLRRIGSAAEPVRADLGRGVRRSLGLPEVPPPRASDPGDAYVRPGSVVRRVHGDLPSMLIGGLSALLLQTLHPLAMAGVADHSAYRDDPLGRLRRTAAFVGATTFGTTEHAREAIERVRRVHRRVRGVAPDGRPYSADDPELITWVHVAEVVSFLRAAQRFGPARLGETECDAYYHEAARVAYELGATWVPRRTVEVEAYLRRVRPELYAGAQALAARDFLLRGVGRRPEDRAVHAVVAAAAVSLLPGWARAELRIPSPPGVDALFVVPLARAVCAGMRWAVAPITPAAR